MIVKRYECGMTNAPTEYQSPTMHQDANGGYVSYEDYAALEARSTALAAENAGLKSAIEKHADSYIMCGYCRTERDGKNDDVCEVLDSTPATDAFLAEVRASGVDSAIEELNQLAERSEKEAPIAAEHHRSAALYMKLFATKLRKGVQS